MNWDFQTVDWTKVQVGDVITKVGLDELDYVHDIYVIKRHNDRIISPEVKITARSYHHYFSDNEVRGAGYSFPTDKDGNPTSEVWAQRIIDLKNDPRYTDNGIEYWENTWREPAVIRCDCGNKVELYMVMTNTCEKCGRDYNCSGQLLAPRNQWGWDTGETPDEILNSDWPIDSTYEQWHGKEL